MEIKYANRMSHVKASEIREILKITQRPEVISFAGGLPAPELFPIQEIIEVDNIVLNESGAKALQYTTTEGFDPLREWISNRMNIQFGTSFDKDNILITNGSQQVLDFSGMVFLDKDDIVLCESPTYLGAINAFRAYECKFIEVQTDDEGMIISNLESILNTTKNVKLIYITPNFQNPTGKTWSLERRQKIAQVSSQHNIVVLEDNPYGDLRFEGENLPSIQSFDTNGNILYTGTFSKIFCPGYRIAWIAGDKDIIRKYVMIKQGADLQCNTLSQMLIAKYLELYNIDEHIAKIRSVYKNRRDLAIKTMSELFPKSVSFTNPQGGLFAWLELPEHINARDVLVKSLEQHVAFVPGGAFFPNGGHENTCRINFSNMSEDKIVEGLTRLAHVLNQFIK